MKTKTKESQNESEETEETYPVYTNNGTITITVSGNNNVVTFMAGQPSTPPTKPPGLKYD